MRRHRRIERRHRLIKPISGLSRIRRWLCVGQPDDKRIEGNPSHALGHATVEPEVPWISSLPQGQPLRVTAVLVAFLLRAFRVHTIVNSIARHRSLRA